MRDLGNLAHQRHDGTGNSANHQSKWDEIELVAAKNRPHPRQSGVRAAPIDDMFDLRQHNLIRSLVNRNFSTPPLMALNLRSMGMPCANFTISPISIRNLLGTRGRRALLRGKAGRDAFDLEVGQGSTQFG